MERRALVIKTMGDPEIAGAIVDGMTRQIEPLNTSELMAMKRELRRLRGREGVRKYREDRDWHKVQQDLDRQYRVPQHGVVYEHVLIAWAITCLFIAECFRRLSEWNRR